MTAPEVSRGRLAELSEQECRELVGTRPIGRIAWRGSEGITVLPVNFELDGDDVLFHTSPYSLMARDCVDRDVAFQVDAVDEVQHAGWTVLLRGRCLRDSRAGSEPTPWVTGPRLLALRVAVSSVSGRRLMPG